MVHLLNSAMMPQPGIYRLIKICQQDFVNNLFDAYQTENLKSYIGYPETASFIESISGVRVEISKEQTAIFPGDIMLIIRLKYRVNPADKKIHKPRPEDFEFFLCEYLGEED